MTAQSAQGQVPAQLPANADEWRAERKARFMHALLQHGTLSAACQASGIPRRTVYDWREADKDFDAAVSQWLYADLEAELFESMFSIATSSDPRVASAAVKAGEFLLKSVNRDRYGDQLRTESTLTINAQMQVADTALDALRARQAQALAHLRTIDAEPTPALPEGGTP